MDVNKQMLSELHNELKEHGFTVDVLTAVQAYKEQYPVLKKIIALYASNLDVAQKIAVVDIVKDILADIDMFENIVETIANR